MRYKIGDHVVIKESNVEFLEEFAGRTGVITRINEAPYVDHHYYIDVDNWSSEGNGVWCSVECLVSSYNTTKIVITTDGKTTTATKYCEDGKKVTATAKCSPEDTFDFNVGAKLAMERLMKAVEPPKYYNGKIVCIDNVCNTNTYTTGKIYEFIDGTFVADNGQEVHTWCGKRYESFEDWNMSSSSKWLEIKE